MNSLTVFIITISVTLLGIFLGLLVSRIESKLSWKQVLIIKYKVLILAPILNIISNKIKRKRVSLDKLYRIQNKLNNELFRNIY